MEHTKGEWTIETPCGFPYSGLYVVPVVRKDFPYYIAQIRQLREREESEANARLIASSPALLAACKQDAELANVAIVMTPTGKERNRLTEINILRLQAIASAE